MVMKNINEGHKTSPAPTSSSSAKALLYAIKYIDSSAGMATAKSQHQKRHGANYSRWIDPNYVAHRQALANLYLDSVRADGGVA